MSRVISGRLPDELADWLDDYAAKRKVKRSVIVEAAVREFMEACGGGVPVLPAPRPPGPSSRQQTSTAARPSLVHVINERQARLNAAKYGRSS